MPKLSACRNIYIKGQTMKIKKNIPTAYHIHLSTVAQSLKADRIMWIIHNVQLVKLVNIEAINGANLDIFVQVGRIGSVLLLCPTIPHLFSNLVIYFWHK